MSSEKTPDGALVRRQGAKVTDEELRECVDAGMRGAAIARRFDCSRAAVSRRMARMRLTTAAASHQPAEAKRFAAATIDGMEQLCRGLAVTNELMDACDEWLSGPDGRYDIGPRPGEVTVIYTVTFDGKRRIKRRKKLSELLAALKTDTDGASFVEIERGETRHADPRTLLLRTVDSAVRTVAGAVDLSEKLASIRVMSALREAVLNALRRASPELAQEVIAELHKALAVNVLLGGVGARSAGASSVGGDH